MIYKKINFNEDDDKDNEDESMDCRGDDHELFGVQD
jgi:hypothetical protein